MELTFWIAIAGIGFAYLGYPALLMLLSVVRPRPVIARSETPVVDVLLVVHNAVDQIHAKLRNLADLDYPADRLRVTVACDGCTDGTAAVVARFPDDRVRGVAFARRRGKSACIGDILPTLQGDIVMFVDVRQTVAPGALLALTAALGDPSVGAASGDLVIEASSGFGAGINAYWRYEKAIRRLESATGSMVGATGALYAARRGLIGPVPPGIILDDMWIPLSVARNGYRTVFVERAIAHDQASLDVEAEETRKRRTLAGNYQLLHRQPRLAIPGLHPLALRLWGHKWLRLLAPWMMLVALMGSAALALDGRVPYIALFCTQLAAYALAIAGRELPWLARRFWPARIAAAFFSLNASALFALGDYLRNRRGHLWQAARHQEFGR